MMKKRRAACGVVLRRVDQAAWRRCANNQFSGWNYQAGHPESLHLSPAMRKRFESVPVEAGR
jgi:hypothetical protein